MQSVKELNPMLINHQSIPNTNFCLNKQIFLLYNPKYCLSIPGVVVVVVVVVVEVVVEVVVDVVVEDVVVVNVVV